MANVIAPDWFRQGSTPGGGVGQALTMPQIPTGQADPSKVGLWQQFRQKLANDPNFRMALMTAGANMLKTPEWGQSGFDTFSNAALTGMGTLDTLRQREYAQTVAEEEREDTQEFRDRRLAQGDERIALARDAEGTARIQRAQQYALDLQRLQNEQNRDTRQTQGPYTGAERTVDRHIEALVSTRSDEFPDTPEGRHKAFLYIQDVQAAKNNPLKAVDLVTTRYQYYRMFDDLSDEEALTKAREEVQMELGLYSPEQQTPQDDTGEATPAARDYNGYAVVRKAEGEGIVQGKDDSGNWLVSFGNDRDGNAIIYTYTQEEMDNLQNKYKIR